MKKIGLFIGVTPHMGGAFQYSQALLKAFDSLDNNIYLKTVVYTDPIWEKYLKNVKAEKVYIKNYRYTYFGGILINCN